jgi:hypothetical protein
MNVPEVGAWVWVRYASGPPRVGRVERVWWSAGFGRWMVDVREPGKAVVAWSAALVTTLPAAIDGEAA